MKKLVYSCAGLILATSAAHAQDAPAPAGEGPPAEAAEPAAPAKPATPAEPADPAAGAPAKPAAPAEPAVPAAPAVAVTDAEIDSFARATVKLQAIQDDAAIAPDQKQPAMAAAVTAEGLNPAKYNAIGKAVQADPELRAKVQVAMADPDG